MTSPFTQLDGEVLSDALAALRDPVPHAKAMCSIAPASSGSCATLAVYPPPNSMAHVANAGDSRAVLVRRRGPGVRGKGGVAKGKGVAHDNSSIEASRHSDDQWRAIPLSVDHTRLNSRERERVNGERPGEEGLFSASGRLLGSAVTQSFSDNKWKWSAEDLEDWKNRFFGRFSSPRVKAPPYITATSEVKSERVCGGDFLVIASDGFWNHISSRDVAHCIGL